MSPIVTNTKTIIARHRLPVFIVIVIGIALGMTSISMTLYVITGASGLDMSRPGYEKARKEVTREQQPEFSAIGGLKESDYQEFLKQYNAQRKILDSLSTFDQESLSDQSLGLVPADPGAPTQ